MPLITTQGAASAQGFGFFRLSAAGGYYYKISTQEQYYTPVFTGVQPLSSGWLINGYRPNTERFAATLDTAGNLINYRQDSQSNFFNIGTMARGGSAVLSSDNVPAWLSGVDRLAFISTTPSYVGTPGGRLDNIAGGLSVLGIDSSNNRVISQGSYSDGEFTNYGYIGATNAATGAGVWVRRYNINGNSWTYPNAALIRPGDSTNVWIAAGYSDKIGYMRLTRASGAETTGFFVSGATTNNIAAGFVSDPSGNLYTGTYNGQIWRMNTSNTLDWARVYSDSASGQNFGYTHICFFDGFLYAIGSQHPNGNYLVRINPSDGTIDWAIKISSPLYGCSGISASANGIMVVGSDSGSSGFGSTYLLNYPLTGGITGTKGEFVFSNMTVNTSSLSLTVNSVSGPSTTSQANPSATTYTSSLNAATSIIGNKTTI